MVSGCRRKKNLFENPTERIINSQKEKDRVDRQRCKSIAAADQVVRVRVRSLTAADLEQRE